MANVNTVFGARVVGHKKGSGYQARIRSYAVPASDGTALFVGDVVSPVQGMTTLADNRMYPTVTQSSAGSLPIGIIVGFEVNPDNLNSTYRTASTLRVVYVCDDEDAIFEIQSTGIFAATAVSQNADITVGSGNTIYGTSGMQLDYTTINTISAQLRVIGISHSVKSELGLYTKALCMFDEHFFKQAAGV